MSAIIDSFQISIFKNNASKSQYRIRLRKRFRTEKKLKEMCDFLNKNDIDYNVTMEWKNRYEIQIENRGFLKDLFESEIPISESKRKKIEFIKNYWRRSF
jgi:hypothetical protein